MSAAEEPELLIARLSHTAASAATTASGTHQLMATGYLAVRVSFLGEPVRRLAVEFHVSKPSGAKGDKVSPDGLQTDDKGCAALTDVVQVGNYWCVIENQPETTITTVDAKDHPIEIPLPVGRPARDLA